MSLARNLFDLADELDITARKHGGNSNSARAFESSRESNAEKREKVFRFVREQGRAGATTGEVVTALGYPANEVSPRMSELKEKKRIVPTGEERKTRRGKNAGVFRVAGGEVDGL